MSLFSVVPVKLPAAYRNDLKRSAQLRTDRARLLILGIHAWVVLCLLPEETGVPPEDVLLHVVPVWIVRTIPLLFLCLGIWTLPRANIGSRMLLLTAVPFTLALSARSSPSIQFGSAGLSERCVSALAMVFYVWAAAWATSRPVWIVATKTRELPAVSIASERRRAGLQSWLIAATALGAFGIVVVAPLHARWALAESSQPFPIEAATLTASVASVLGTSVVALFVAPAMRSAGRYSGGRRWRRFRFVAGLIAVGIGALLLELLDS